MQINLFPDASLLAILVIFILNYLVVRQFFLMPINAVIEAREHDVRTSEKAYEEAMTRYQQATADVENQLHAAKREAAQVRENFRGEAASHRSGVVEKTQAEAKNIVSEADRQLTADVQTARETIVRESERLAQLAAERILGRPV